MTINLDSGYNAWTASSPIPPDSAIAVGNTYTVQAYNGKVAYFNKSDGTKSYQTNLSSFFNISSGTSYTDPRAVYDYRKDRYLIVITGYRSDNTGFWKLANSNTSDPHNGWNLLTINPPDPNYFPDFPGLAVGNNTVSLTGDMFNSYGGSTYYRTDTPIIDKSSLYSTSTSATYTVLSGIKNPDGSDAFRLMPAHKLTDSSTVYFMSTKRSGANWINLVTVNKPFGATTVNSHKIPLSFTYSPHVDVTQGGTTNKLHDLSASLNSPVIYENGSFWLAHTINYNWTTSDSQAIIEWYEIDESTLSVIQDGGFGNQDVDYYEPVVMANKNGEMMLSYSQSSHPDKIYPSFEITGRRPSDSSGKLEQGKVVKSGVSGYDPSINSHRWGDYGSMSLDPSNTSYFWAQVEYTAGPSNQDQYGLWTEKAHMS